jgi:kynurenine formamidase
MRARQILQGAIFFIGLNAMFFAAPSAGAKGSANKLLEMTYPFNDSSIYWPTGKAFQSTRVFWGINQAGWWYASNDYSANEHGGTHVDAPIHFAQGGRTLDQIPLSEWIGPAVKIDVRKKCAQNINYRLTVEDLQAFEKKQGKIPDGAWVIMFSGIGTQYYPDRKKVLGTEVKGEQAIRHLQFPGFSTQAVQFLVERRTIRGIAIDTPSIDYGKSKDFEAHRALCKADKLAIENIAALDQLPPTGATLYAMPMLIQGGTGAPARVFALLP